MTVRELYTVQIHPATYSTDDLVLNRDIFTDIFVPGDFVQIIDVTDDQNYHHENAQQLSLARSGLILKVSSMQPGRLEVSIHKQVAEALGIKQFARVTVNRVEAADYEVDFVELTFRRQFLQRGNMWRFKESMFGRPVYLKQQVTQVGGVLPQIQEMARKNVPQISGIISKSTQFIFRSRSTRIIWLVQISSEMWKYDERGYLYFEKFLIKFVAPVLDIWKSLQVSHSLSIVYFARSVESLNSESDFGAARSQASPLSSAECLDLTTSSLIKHKDYFKVVIENAAEFDKYSYMKTLRQEFWEFSRSVGWQVNESSSWTPTSSHSSGISEPQKVNAVPSNAAFGNFLEAINTALNLLDKHYMDRDLLRTGNSIVVISAGCGFYHVTPDLSLITKQRMMDGGIGIDFISLCTPPMHHVPLFHVHCHSQFDVGDFYDFPYWINVSFVDCAKDSSATIAITNKGQSLGIAKREKTDGLTSGRIPQRDGTSTGNRLTVTPGLLWNEQSKQYYYEEEFGKKLYPQPFNNAILAPLIDLMDFIRSSKTLSSDPELVPLISEQMSTITSDFSYLNMGNTSPTISVWGYFDVEAYVRQTKQHSKSGSRMFERIHERNHLDGASASKTSFRENMKDFRQAFTAHHSLSMSSLYHQYATKSSKSDNQSVASSHGSDSNNRDSFHLQEMAHSVTNQSDPSVLDELNDIFACLTKPKYSNPADLLAAMSEHDSTVFTLKSKISKRFLSSKGLNELDKLSTTLEDITNNNFDVPKVFPLHISGNVTDVEKFLRQYLHESDEKAKLKASAKISVNVYESYELINVNLDYHNAKFSAVYLFDINVYKLHSWNEFRKVPELLDSSTLEPGLVDERYFKEVNLNDVHANRTSNAATRSSSHDFSLQMSEDLHDDDDTEENAYPNKYLKSTVDVGILIPNKAFENYPRCAMAVQQVDDQEAVRRTLASSVSAYSVSPSPQNSYLSNRYSKRIFNREPSVALAKSPTNNIALSPASTTSIMSGGLGKFVKHASRSWKDRSSHSAFKSDCGSPQISFSGEAHGITNQQSINSNPEPISGTLSRKIVEDYRNKRKLVNPFSKEDGVNYRSMRTHNRLRWAYVFPSGAGHDFTTKYYGLNLKSLCQPAVLPLGTSFLTPVTSLENDFKIGYYSLLIDTKQFNTEESARNRVIEMIGHRLSQEFQLVEGIDMTPHRTYLSTHLGGNFNPELTQDEELHILSMGHYIHFISYNRVQKEIKVFWVVSKKAEEGNGVVSNYSYNVWVQHTGRYQEMTQKFAQYPTSRYDWNKADLILLGDPGLSMEVSDPVKPKRLRFLVIPDLASTSVEEEMYFAKLEKLVQFFKTKMKGDSQTFSVEYERVFQSMPHMSNISSSSTNGTTIDGDTSTQVGKDQKQSHAAASQPGTTASLPSTPTSATTKSFFNISSSSSTSWSRGSPSLPSSSSSKNQNHVNLAKLWLRLDEKENEKWLVLRSDRTNSLKNIYHFEFFWIACDSWLVYELVNALFVKCQFWNLRLVQSLEFFSSHDMQIHPYRSQPYFLFSDRYIKSPNVSPWKHAYIRKHLLEASITNCTSNVNTNPTKLWLRERDQRTAWEELQVFAPIVKHMENHAMSKLTPRLQTTNSLEANQACGGLKSILESQSQSQSQSQSPSRNSLASAASLASIGEVIPVDKAVSVTPFVKSLGLSKTAHDQSTVDPSSLNLKHEHLDSTKREAKASTSINYNNIGVTSLIAPIATPKLTPQNRPSHSSLASTFAKFTSGALSHVFSHQQPHKALPLPEHISERKSLTSTNLKFNIGPRRSLRSIDWGNDETQYINRYGSMCVRFAPNGIICLMNLNTKLSDINITDKEKNMTLGTLHEFLRLCEAVDVCTDIVDELVTSVLYLFHSCQA